MWFWYALVAALLGAISVVVNKRALEEVNASVLTWAIFAFQLPLLLFFSFVGGRVTVLPSFWVGIVASSAVFVVGKTISLSSMKQSVLSKITPLATLSVAFSYLLGMVLLGETLRLLPVAGLVLLIVGAYTLNVVAVRESWVMPLLLLWRGRGARVFFGGAVVGGGGGVF